MLFEQVLNCTYVFLHATFMTICHGFAPIIVTLQELEGKDNKLRRYRNQRGYLRIEAYL